MNLTPLYQQAEVKGRKEGPLNSDDFRHLRMTNTTESSHSDTFDSDKIAEHSDKSGMYNYIYVDIHSLIRKNPINLLP